MEKATFAPAYVSIYPHLCEIARENGYALCIHGSVGKNYYSDLDLLACPWTDDCKDADTLAKAFWDWIKKMVLDDKMVSLFEQNVLPQDKPHGRKSWFFQVGNGSGIDLSVMPKLRSN